MRFLVDENLSPRLCLYLTASGDEARHAHQAAGAGASDQAILDYATSHGAVIITADTDFGGLLARAKTSMPSVILVRELLSLPVPEQGRLLAANLPGMREILDKGAIVVFSRTGMRVRPLPFQ